LGILDDLANIIIEFGGKLIANCPNFFDDWIMKHG